MSDGTISFHHVHIISQDPEATVAWFVDKLGGRVANRTEFKGAPQVRIDFDGAFVNVRGQRTGEKAGPKGGLEWGTDHFGFQVKGDFDAYCAALKAKGVEFTVEPMDFNPTTRIAFIQAPDGVSIELLHRKGG